MQLREPGSILLISCYELGHQPLGIAHPLGYLKRAGFAPAALDISVQKVDDNKICKASLIGISVPMHTALRLGVQLLARIKKNNPKCYVVFYGHYAALNSGYLFEQGAHSCLGGESETRLVELLESLEAKEQGTGESNVSNADSTPLTKPPNSELPIVSSAPSMDRLKFAVPDRSSLPQLSEYAKIEENGQQRTVGYVEASRGCLLKCRHCPIPPVYEGRFFIVPTETVIEDIRQQVAAGATHITFGDPDFLNGPKHSLRVIRQMHREFPDLTFDFTAKVEHLLNRGDDLQEFAQSGCLFVISAVESVSEKVLSILDKEHTVSDMQLAIERVRAAGITPRPTWVAFTPWTTWEDYVNMLTFVESNRLIDHVDPVQFSVRLLVPPGSWLENHPDMLPYRGPLDEAALTYRWEHPDPRMDALAKQVSQVVELDTEADVDPIETFYRIFALVQDGSERERPRESLYGEHRAPRLMEPWFC